jgi:tetratricopeptide (TPR) repeat protein
MSSQHLPEPHATLAAGSISRQQAAQLLKLARGIGGDVVAEAVDWAYAAMPDRAIVQRLKARSLLRTGQLEEADALIAQALLIYPTDPVLSTMRAERLLAKGRLGSATSEIDLVIAQHPDRPSALALGATIAAKHGDHVRAIALLERAVEVRPLDMQIRIQLIEAMLAGVEPVQAAHQIAFLADPPALLEARVLHAEGRALDALARLETEWSCAPVGEQADEIAAAIVDLLEEVGRLETLQQFANTLDTSHPKALARAAQAWLVLGRFDEAIAMGAQLLKRRAFVPIGRGILLVAATMKGNFGIARRVVRQLITSELTIDRISLADLWRRGIIGKLICTHTALGAIGTNGHHSVLSSLAQSAAELFREQLAEAEASANPTEAADLMHLIRQCSLQPRVETMPQMSLKAVTDPIAVEQDAADEPVLARRAA